MIDESGDPAEEIPRKLTRAEVRLQRAAERQAMVNECEQEFNAVLQKYGAAIQVVRMIRLDGSGAERVTYTLEVQIPE